MTERFGYIGRAADALRRSPDPKDAEYARALESLIAIRGGDIFVARRTPREALDLLNASETTHQALEDAAVCFNISPKTAVALALTGHVTSKRDIQEWFTTTFNGTSVGEFKAQQGVAYCATLAQFGMAEKVGSGYKATPKGIEMQPVAARILQFENDETYSLYPELGQTQTSAQQRAPINRIKMLLYLAHDTKRDDFEQALHMKNSVILETLFSLQKTGILTYDPFILHYIGQSVQYEFVKGWDTKPTPSIRDSRRLTDLVVEACKKLHEQNKPLLPVFVDQLLTSDIPSPKSEPRKREVSRMMSGLAKAGILSRISTIKTKAMVQSATLTDRGKKLVYNLLIPLVDAVNNGETLQQWKEDVLPSVRRNLVPIARHTAELYYPHSNQFKETRRSELMDDIIEYVQRLQDVFTNEFGEPEMRAEDIALLTETNCHTTYTLLEELVRQGRITKRKSHSIFTYSLA